MSALRKNPTYRNHSGSSRGQEPFLRQWRGRQAAGQPYRTIEKGWLPGCDSLPEQRRIVPEMPLWSAYKHRERRQTSSWKWPRPVIVPQGTSNPQGPNQSDHSKTVERVTYTRENTYKSKTTRKPEPP